MSAHPGEPCQPQAEPVSVSTRNPSIPYECFDLYCGLVKNKSWEKVKPILAERALSNVEVVNLVRDCNNRDLENFVRARGKLPVIRINQVLQDVDKINFEINFSEYKLDFKNAVDCSGHYVARAYRRASYIHCLKSLGFTEDRLRVSKPLSGYDVVIKEVGGNPMLPFSFSFLHYHVCFAYLSFDDAVRQNSFLESLRKVNYSDLSNVKKTIYKSYVDNDSLRICRKKSQNCKVSSQNLLSIHSTYDMTPYDMAVAMHSARALVFVGVIHFSPDILIKNSGELQHVKMFFKKYICKKTKRVRICFYFKNDAQNSYDHDYLTYLSKFFTFQVTYKSVQYLLQWESIKGDCWFFKMYRNICGTIPQSHPYRVFTIPSFENKVFLKYFKYSDVPLTNSSQIDAKFSQYERFKPYYAIVSSKFINLLYNYAVSLPDGKFLMANILPAATTFNTRENISGEAVAMTDRINCEELPWISLAIMIRVYIEKYGLTKMYQAYRLDEERVRLRKTLKKFLPNSPLTVKELALTHSLSSQLVDEDCGFFSSIFKFFKNLFCSDEEIKRNFDIVLDFSPECFSFDEYLPKFSSSVERFDKGFCEYSLQDILPPIPETREPPALVNKLIVREHVCEENLEIVVNNSHGLCFLHTLVGLGLVPDIGEGRRRLKNSVYFPEFNFDLDIREGESSESWVDMSIFELIVLEFDVTLCLHTDNGCRMYLNTHGVDSDSREIYHVHFSQGHAQAMRIIDQMPPVVEVDIVLDSMEPYPNEELLTSHTAVAASIMNTMRGNLSENAFNRRLKNARGSYYKYNDVFNGNYICRSAYKTKEILLRYFPDQFDSVLTLGGPGGEVQVLLENTYSKIYGFTLCGVPTDYSPILLDEERFVILTGSAFDGDILNPENHNHACQYIRRSHPDGVDRFFCDLASAGDDDSFSKNDENFNLVLNSFRMMLITLRIGGNAYFKISHFDRNMMMLIELIGQSFDRTILTKLLSSRPASMETHLICYGFKGMTDGLLNLDHFNVIITNPEVVSGINVSSLVDAFVDPAIRNLRLLKLYFDSFSTKSQNRPPIRCDKKTSDHLMRIFKRNCSDKVGGLLSASRVIIEDVKTEVVRKTIPIKGILSKILPIGGSEERFEPNKNIGITYDDSPRADLISILSPSSDIDEIAQDCLDSDRMLPAPSAPPLSAIGAAESAVGEYTVMLKEVMHREIDAACTIFSLFKMTANKSNITNHPGRNFVLNYSGLKFKLVSGVGKLIKQSPLTIQYNNENIVYMNVINVEQRKLMSADHSEKFSVGHYVVNDYCSVSTDLMIYRNLHSYSPKFDNIRFELIQAVPGAGKTTMLLNRVISYLRDGKSFIVLLPTKTGKEDFRSRLKKLCKRNDLVLTEQQIKNVTTIFSYCVRHSTFLKPDVLLIDEVMMHHPGLPLAAIAFSNCKLIVAVGDRLQIPFVNVLGNYKLKYQRISDIYPINVVKDLSYRCPVDIAKRLSKDYEKTNNLNLGMKSAREIFSSVKLKRISSIHDVPKSADAQYLTFTQAEKNELIAFGVKTINTVHEFQGNESDNVIVVRLNSKVNENIYLRSEYALVALTRHKVSLIYYTKVLNDALSRLINPSGTELDGQLFTMNELKHYFVSKVGGKVSNLGFSLVDRVSYDRDFRSFRRSMKSFDSVRPRIVFTSKYAVVGHGYDSDVIMRVYDNDNQVMSMRMLRACLKNFVPRSAVYYFSGEIFEKVSEYVLSYNLYKAFPEVKFIAVRPENKASPPQVMQYSLTNVLPMFRPVTTVIEPVVDNSRFYVPPQPEFTIEICSEMLQKFLDARFGELDYVDQSFDAYIISQSDLNMNLRSISYSPITSPVKISAFDCLSPVLRTPQPMLRNLTCRETLLAFEKRNGAVPNMLGSVAIMQTAEFKIKNLIETCFDEEIFLNLTKHAVYPNASELYEWLQTQPLAVTDAILDDLPVENKSLNSYIYSLKRSPKPNLETETTKTYISPQSIVYWSKDINAYFATIWREVKRICNNSLRPYIFTMVDVSVEDFEERFDRKIRELNGDVEYTWENISFVFVSGDDMYIKFKDGATLEIDISKYDKSQWLLDVLFDCLLMQRCRVPQRFVNLWLVAHIHSECRDLFTKMKAYVTCQRKSGDPSTYWGNTMKTLSDLAMFEDLATLQRRKTVDAELIHSYQTMLNLEVKIFSYKTPYFCSKFFGVLNGRFWMVPDPVKMIVKFGRSDLVNYNHVREYQTSLIDLCKPFLRFDVCSALSDCLADRYKYSSDYTILLFSLPKFVSSVEFENMFYIKPGAVIDHKRLEFHKDR